METTGERPPLLTRAEVAVGNAVPVFGVAFLGWEAVTVVFLYLLDAWFSILGLGASVIIRIRAELASMLPKSYSRLHRALSWAGLVGAVEAIVSVFALIPFVLVLGHLGRTPEQALAQVFRDPSVRVPVLTLIASHAVRIVRGVRDPEEGSWGLSAKLQMALFASRMFLMMLLAGLASPGFLGRFLVPLYVALVAAVFTYSDLYPRQFLARFGAQGPDRPDGDMGVTGSAGAARPR